MPVNPLIAEMLREINRWDAEHGAGTSIDDERRRIDLFRRTIWRPEMLPVGSVSDRTIAGPGGDIGLRIYRPENDAPAPVVLYFHGGGWCVGNLDSHESHARRICQRLGAVVIGVDYRLAPEHKFPAGYDDCVASYRWVLDNAASLGVDPARIVVAGDSAGGNLAAAVAVSARDARLPLAAQLLIYPATDLSSIRPSMRELHTGYFLEVDDVNQWLDNSSYLDNPSLATDPRVSPLLADLAGVAPAVVLVAEYDPLKDQGTAYAEKLRNAGSTVIYREAAGMIHSFANMGVVPEAVAAFDRACADLALILDGAASDVVEHPVLQETR